MESLHLSGRACSTCAPHAGQPFGIRIGVAWRRWCAGWAIAWARPRAMDRQVLHALSQLDARTLRDIGAPEVLVSAAEQDVARCSCRRHAERGLQDGGLERMGGRDPRW